jgi:hypothetical protein
VTDEQTDAIWDAQEDEIRTRWGAEAAEDANYGWFVDEVSGFIATKVYGHGVLTTDVALNHEFEEFR